MELFEQPPLRKLIKGGFALTQRREFQLLAKFWLLSLQPGGNLQPQQESSILCCDTGTHVSLPPAHLPPAYITASMMEEIQETLLLDALKMISISLKNTVMDLGKA